MEPFGHPDTSEDSEVQILSIEPDWGPTAGGTLVTITGIGFDGQIGVLFDDAVLSVTKLDAETLLVTSPPSAVEVQVDVTVESDLGKGIGRDGFTYSDSGPPPDTGSPDTGSAGTGLVGGYAEFSLLQIACPACVGMTTGLDVNASAVFHEPSTGSWLSWLPAEGTCLANPTPAVPTSTRLDVGEWVYLTAGSESIGLWKTMDTAGTTYKASGLDNSDFLRNAYFDLSVPDTGALGAFELEDALLTPQGFDTIEPYEMLYSHPDSAWSASISISNAQFTWAPTGGSGSFVILLAVLDSSGTISGQVMCRGADNGSMMIPSTYLSGYSAYSGVLVYMYRYRFSNAVIPSNGSTFETVGQSGFLGTGVLTP